MLLLVCKHNIGVVIKPLSFFIYDNSKIHDCNTRYCRSIHLTFGKSEVTN